MAWDFTTHREVIRNRMRFASPDHVYKALEEYGAYSQQTGYYSGDPELERLLFERNNPLIDLGLARYGHSYDGALTQIYKRARDGSGDADYDRAIHLACLSNPLIVAVMDSTILKAPTEQDKGELYRLAMEGDDDELTTLMRNPGARALLRTVYAREGALQDIPEERWLKLVEASVGNPGLNRDDTNSSGPDSIAWNIRKALRDLVASAPATPDWVRALHQVLLEMNPAQRWLFEDEKAVLDVLDRWKGIKVKSTYDADKDETGQFSGLPIADEFRCLIAAVYGQLLIDRKLVPVGSPDSDDVALRCAWYGNGKMTPKEVAAARERDGAILAFAAQFNAGLMLNPQTRAEVEEVVSWHLNWLRDKRYAQLKAEYTLFDPRPANELLEVREQAMPSAGTPDMATLAAQVTELGSKLASLIKAVIWGLIVVAALVLWRR